MVRDEWALGDAYEAYIGRWSRPVAAAFLGWLNVPAGRTWLDVGCGTGALTAAILATVEPTEVLGIDPSQGFLARARTAVDDPRAAFVISDAHSLPVPDASVDAVVSGLALNFVPDPPEAVAEFVRVARAGAVVAGYVWDYAGGMAMLRHFWDAVVALDPDAANLDEGHRFPLCRPGPLRRLWMDAGLRDVGVTSLDVETPFASMEDYWTPFLGGQGPAPGYVASLPEEYRRVLRARLESRLPIAADGSIHLTARAWAVRGTVAAERAASA